MPRNELWHVGQRLEIQVFISLFNIFESFNRATAWEGPACPQPRHWYITLQGKCAAGTDCTGRASSFLSASVVDQLNGLGDQLFQTVFITLSIYVRAKPLQHDVISGRRPSGSIRQDLLDLNGNLIVCFNLASRRQ